MLKLETTPATLTREIQGLATLPTPCLLVDEAKMDRNIARLRYRLAGTGVRFRPHLKTAKSVEVAWRMMEAPQGPATASTLREVEQFANAGVTDLTYAVGIAPDKLERVRAIRRSGVDLTIVLDSLEQARAVAQASDPSDPIPVLIEIDCDGHRSGVKPDDKELILAIAKELVPRAEMRGVLTHAGDSYFARGRQALEAAAEQERLAVVQAVQTLRAAGFPAPVVSVGSTPTAFHAQNFEGITEMRAGVFVFFDLFQTGVGISTVDDNALSVLTTVIGHQRPKGWTIVDAGWMALSRDRGTARQEVDQGYGIVCGLDGRPLKDLLVVDASQEHGIIALRSGAAGEAPDLPVGTRLRILPNHACAAGAQHDRYHVIGAGASDVTATWSRFSGW